MKNTIIFLPDLFSKKVSAEMCDSSHFDWLLLKHDVFKRAKTGDNSVTQTSVGISRNPLFLETVAGKGFSLRKRKFKILNAFIMKVRIKFV